MSNNNISKSDLSFQVGDLENKPRIRNTRLTFPSLIGKWIIVNTHSEKSPIVTSIKIM